MTAKNTATVESGGDTTLDGAVVNANTVKVDVGGNLLIRSQQDTGMATADQSGGGFDASICYFWCDGTPVVVGGSVSSAGGNGRYVSVTEQSGILVQMAPQLVEASTQLLTAGSTSGAMASSRSQLPCPCMGQRAQPASATPARFTSTEMCTNSS